MKSNLKKTILLTGASGFLGKVILEELVRKKDELDISQIFLLIRPKKGKNAFERFDSDIQTSLCFSRLPSNWSQDIQVFSSRLTESSCGLNKEDTEIICNNVTHVIHCAASISFNMPLKDAAAANITSALNVSELADQCKNIDVFVNVSTAYVSPPTDKIPEQLFPLKRSAAEIYQKILSEDFNQKELLAEAGHVNTYTFTKCLAEHLLIEKSRTPLKIVRPSIISASWKMPFPGWIDSPAAFAGFVALIGSGQFTVLRSNPNSISDIVPVDEVSHQVIEACFESDKTTSIRHATCGINHSNSIEQCFDAIVESFSKNPFAKKPKKIFIARDGFKVKFLEWIFHFLAAQVAFFIFKILRNSSMERKITRLVHQRHILNTTFSYFLNNTFDFIQKRPMKVEDFDSKKYLSQVCSGVSKYLIDHDLNEKPLKH